MKPYLKYGLLAALVCIFLSFAVSIGHLESRMIGYLVNLLTYVSITVAIILALRDKRSRLGDYLSFGQGLGEGMRVTLVAGIVTAIAHYINLKFINHALTQSLYDKIDDALEAKDLSAEEMETAGRWAKMMITPGGQTIMVILGYLVIGFIISLVAAAILRKETYNDQLPTNNYQ